ncbi:MAG: alpha/beta fold hydrolase [Candidatus Binataceae bacterium]
MRNIDSVTQSIPDANTGEHAWSQDLYIETNGARLRYRDEGRGPAVVLVHGWTLDLDMWEAQAAALTSSFRVIRLDRRGFGLSSGHPSITGDAADLYALCEHLGLRSVSLVGMSQAARVVLRLANMFPAKTSCVILDGPPRIGAEDATSISDDLPYKYYCGLAQARGLAAFRNEWSEHPLARLRTLDPAAHAVLSRMIARYPGKDLTDSAPRSYLASTAHELESLSQPVLVINGQFDLESRKRFAQELSPQLRHVEYVEIPDAGHLCNLDNPLAYNQALREFLERYAIPSRSH